MKLKSNFFFDRRLETSTIESLTNLISDTFIDNFYCSDNLIAVGRNLKFLSDARFVEPIFRHSQTGLGKAIIWRLHTLYWATRQVLRQGLTGDFLEVGCNRGETARIIADWNNFASVTSFHYYLLDLFVYDEKFNNKYIPKDEVGMETLVRSKFTDLPMVKILKGDAEQMLRLEDIRKIAFVHLDLNSRDAEIRVLDLIEPLLEKNAIIILDDYGWAGYSEQCHAEYEWFGKRGRGILELPTGQGVVVW